MSNIAVCGVNSVCQGDDSSLSTSSLDSSAETHGKNGSALAKQQKKIPPIFTELLQLREDKKSKVETLDCLHFYNKQINVVVSPHRSGLRLRVG